MGACCGQESISIKKDTNTTRMDSFRPRNYKIKVNGKDLERNQLVMEKFQPSPKTSKQKHPRNLFKTFSDWGDQPPQQYEAIEAMATKARARKFSQQLNINFFQSHSNRVSSGSGDNNRSPKTQGYVRNPEKVSK